MAIEPQIDDQTENNFLEQLASSERSARGKGTMGLFFLSSQRSAATDNLEDDIREVLECEWAKLPNRGAHFVEGLHQTLLEEEGLLIIEITAMALATQGEDGLTTLLSSNDSGDFAIRSKVAIGIGILRSQARWAVPTLLRRLEREHVPLVFSDILRALVRIGGSEAEEGLALLLKKAQQNSLRSGTSESVINKAISHLRQRHRES